MSTTDRIDTLGTRRETTDRLGETVILGNSILSGDVGMSATIVAAAAGSSRATARVQVSLTATLTMFNGSFGIISGFADFDATATCSWRGAQMLKGAMSASSSASALFRGAAVASSNLDSDGVALLGMNAATALTGQATATLTWAGRSTATGAIDSDAVATLAPDPNPLASATYSETAAALLQGYSQLPADLSISAVLTAGFAGAAIARSNFDMDAAASATFYCLSFFNSSATATCTWGGSSTATSRFDMDGVSAGVFYGDTPPSEFTMTAQLLASAAGGSVARSTTNWGVTETGYICGGFSGSSSTGTVSALRYASQSAQTINATLAVARQSVAGVNASAKGYCGGGTPNSTPSSEIDGVDFINETQVNPSAVLSVARYSLTGIQSSTKGYFCGGYVSLDSSEIDGIQYSDETAINPTAALSTARSYPTGASSSTKGYVAGGYDGVGAENTVEAFTFASETVSTLASTLSVPRYAMASAQSATNGYFTGGASEVIFDSTEIEGVRFSDDTLTNPSVTLATSRTNHIGTQSATAGYFTAGFSSFSPSSTTDVLQFSGETMSSYGASLTTAARDAAGLSSTNKSPSANLTFTGTAA